MKASRLYLIFLIVAMAVLGTVQVETAPVRCAVAPVYAAAHADTDTVAVVEPDDIESSRWCTFVDIFWWWPPTRW